MILYGRGFYEGNPERLQYTNSFILILWKILLRDLSGIYPISFSFVIQKAACGRMLFLVLGKWSHGQSYQIAQFIFHPFAKYNYFSSNNKCIKKGEITNLLIT